MEIHKFTFADYSRNQEDMSVTSSRKNNIVAVEIKKKKLLLFVLCTSNQGGKGRG